MIYLVFWGASLVGWGAPDPSIFDGCEAHAEPATGTEGGFGGESSDIKESAGNENGAVPRPATEDKRDLSNGTGMEGGEKVKTGSSHSSNVSGPSSVSKSSSDGGASVATQRQRGKTAGGRGGAEKPATPEGAIAPSGRGGGDSGASGEAAGGTGKVTGDGGARDFDRFGFGDRAADKRVSVNSSKRPPPSNPPGSNVSRGGGSPAPVSESKEGSGTGGSGSEPIEGNESGDFGTTIPSGL